ncbi:nad dependent epimerase dehydratase family [Trichoderma arundinaceum]|uniref:Nad dependent epimerase dehydratase family n=1 Tax=Trichoderma arundinaceum TaxID=490622 RepID=A0A395NK47_TRIAR|nr:nad dependent epimerase dehydratase family [Trichoderma arundinaceum]
MQEADLRIQIQLEMGTGCGEAKSNNTLMEWLQALKVALHAAGAWELFITLNSYLDPAALAGNTPSPAFAMGAFLARLVRDSDCLQFRDLVSLTWYHDGVGKEYGCRDLFLGPNFELVEVPDVNSHGAFDTVLGGVDGVAHIAMNMDMNPSNQAIIEDTIKSNLQLLEAAARESSVKSVVITSSLAVCILPTLGTPYKIDPTTWNTSAIEQTAKPWDAGGNPRWRGIVLYGASKARGEQEAFAWMRKHKPAISFNTVVPNVNFGIAVSPESMSYRITSAVLDAVVKGYPAAPSILPPQWYVDVEDTALLHLGALTLDDVSDERLPAFAGKYSWTQVLEILHRRYLQKILLKLVDEPLMDAGEVDNERSIQVLKKMGKEEGFTSLEDTLVKAVDTIIENQPKNVPKTRIDLYYDSLASNSGD